MQTKCFLLFEEEVQGFFQQVFTGIAKELMLWVEVYFSYGFGVYWVQVTKESGFLLFSPHFEITVCENSSKQVY